MNSHAKGAAVRLTFSILALSALGGCAVYAPAPGPYAYYGSDVNGQPVYAAPYGTPYSTVSPYYYAPAYAVPPVSLNLGLGYWRGDNRGGYRGGYRGGRGGGGRR
jgi:hypothetical protein